MASIKAFVLVEAEPARVRDLKEELDQMIVPDVSGRPFTLLLDTWHNGWWTLGYARPLVTDSPMGIQFLDLRHTYHFGLDIASGDGSAHTRGEEVLLRFASG